MVGQPVWSYTFSKKRQVKTLASAAYVKTSTGERIEIDQRHLYQRLLIMGVGEIPLVDLLQYELCSFPAFLFDNQLFMRSGHKAELIHCEMYHFFLTERIARCHRWGWTSSQILVAEAFHLRLDIRNIHAAYYSRL